MKSSVKDFFSAFEKSPVIIIKLLIPDTKNFFSTITEENIHEKLRFLCSVI